MNKREIIHQIKYGTIKPQITDRCPKCGGIAYGNRIDIGNISCYEPLHCKCGWWEMCSYKNKESCKKCDQYERCYKTKQ